jgi:isopenicillin N synthase-like dioxygenase
MTGEDQIASVDIGTLFERDSVARRACDAALWAGLRRTGSVLLTGFPDADKVDERARTGLEVFDLPAAQRRAMSTATVVEGNPNWYRGYWPCTPERLLQNDFFDVGPDKPEDGPDLPGIEILTEATPWPDPEPRPGWSGTVRAHYEHLNTVGLALIRSIGRSAGFDEAVIRDRYDGRHSTLRFLHYHDGAANPQPAPDGAILSAGRHTDANGLSLLWQDSPGLQAEGQDGVFRDIPTAPNAISLHVGDVMTRFSGGLVPATPHRVLAAKGPRRSVGFFLEPRLSSPVTPADRPDSETTLRDTYAWQLLSTIAKRPQWKGRIRDPEETMAG